MERRERVCCMYVAGCCVVMHVLPALLAMACVVLRSAARCCVVLRGAA